MYFMQEGSLDYKIMEMLQVEFLMFCVINWFMTKVFQ